MTNKQRIQVAEKMKLQIEHGMYENELAIKINNTNGVSENVINEIMKKIAHQKIAITVLNEELEYLNSIESEVK